MKKFFTWLLAFPTIVCVILLGCYRFHLNGQAEWITLITAWISSTATILLGIVVFCQTENHKKRQEEDNALYQEQADKNRQQDLMLRANPHAIFNKIECINYSDSSVIKIFKDDTYNRLTNIDYEGVHVFNEQIQLDLNFIVPQNNVLERIYIKSAQLNCYKGDFAGDNYEEIKSFSLFNYSKEVNKTNIKIVKQGEVSVLLSLLFDLDKHEEFMQREVKKFLDNTELKWFMTITYTLSNSFKVEIGYKTNLKFKLYKEKIKENDDSIYSLVDMTFTTIQTNNIRVAE